MKNFSAKISQAYCRVSCPGHLTKRADGRQQIQVHNQPGRLHWVCYEPTLESQNQNSRSDYGKLVFAMLLSKEITKKTKPKWTNKKLQNNYLGSIWKSRQKVLGEGTG